MNKYLDEGKDSFPQLQSDISHYGDDTSVEKMVALGIPFDVVLEGFFEEYINFQETIEEEFGIERILQGQVQHSKESTRTHKPVC